MRLLLLSCLLLASASFAVETVCEHCNKALLPQPLHPRPGRKYARDRLVDLVHLKLDVTPDFARRTVAATTEWTFKPIARPLAQLELDAVGLEIEAVTAQGTAVASYQVTEEKLVIVFQTRVPVDASVNLAIRYRVQPENGLYFRTPEMGYKPGDTQLWTQGEAELHRYWFPCYDYPNERFTSEVICHVPEGMEVISNGHLVGSAKDAQGLNAVHWLQDKPHVNYLVALAAGYFHKIEARAGELPLAMLVPPSEKDQAANAFRDTRNIIDFYQKEIGVPFAWDKYYQVYCLDFLAGGMENTSCTFQAAGLLFPDGDEQLSTLHGLDAHEAAHQWFGDLVTSRDWSHLWLNEGFASYYTILYEEEKNGHDAMLYSLWREAQAVLSQTDTKPTVWRDYQDAMEQFDYRVYPKGAWILHMVRSRLGPDLYRRCIKTYVERHRNQVVGTDDLHDVLDDLTGLSWDQFFDQWLYHGGVPDLALSYSYDAGTKMARVNVKQQQKVSDQVPLFALDLPVRFFLKDKAVDFSVRVSQAEEDFHFALDSAPDLVRFDPEYTLLAKVSFTPPGDMLKKQLKGDVIGRMLAAQKLGERSDHESVEMLKGLLATDAFHAVRTEAARALKKIGNDEARSVLAGSLNQPDARVRREVVEALSAFPHNEARLALWKQAQTEKNPLILASIIRTWGARPGDTEVAAALRKHLASTSYSEEIANAAIAALRAQDDSSAAPAILARLQQNPANFDSRSYASALDALGFLARKDKDRSAIRRFLAQQLNHPKLSIRAGATKALGTLKDPAAIALLEPLTQVLKPFNDPVREAAVKAMQSLQSERESPAELKNVWQRLDDLARKEQELRKQVEDLKKQAKPEKKK